MVVMAVNCWWKLPDRLFLFCLFRIHHLISLGKNSPFTPHSKSCSFNTPTQRAGGLTPVAWPPQHPPLQGDIPTKHQVVMLTLLNPQS